MPPTTSPHPQVPARARKHVLPGAALALAALLLGYFLWANAAYLTAHVRYALGVHGNVPDISDGDGGAAQSADVEPHRLWIPAIGLEAVPVTFVTETNEEAYQAALLGGVAHYPRTAEFGQKGNAYVFGHSSDYASSRGEYKTVFALLSKLKPGDVIVASDFAGRPFTYAVTETFVVEPDDFSVLDQFNYERSVLTLQTSWPLGTALRRYIVRAELVEPEASGQPAQ